MKPQFILSKFILLLLTAILLQAANARDIIDGIDPTARGMQHMSEYVRDANRKDWDNGYIRDALGRYQPLNGAHPDQFGDGGGTPWVYYKVDKDTDESTKSV